MPKKRKPSFFSVFIRVFVNWVILFFLCALIPATIQVYQFFGGTVKMLENIPAWAWFSPLVVYIIFVVVRSVYLYRKELNDYASSKKQPHKTKRKINKADNRSVAIQDSPHAQSTSNSNNSNVNQTAPNGNTYAANRDFYQTINNPITEKSKPNILLYIDDNGHFATIKTIQLKALPSKPNYESLLRDKKEELHQKFEAQLSLANKSKPKSGFGNEIDAMVDAYEIFTHVDRRIKSQEEYSKSVDEYLPRYREYLSKQYIASIIMDRCHKIKIVVENQGEKPATDVVIEIYIDNILASSDIREIKNQIEFRSAMNNRQVSDYEPTKPQEPDCYTVVEEDWSQYVDARTLHSSLAPVDVPQRNPRDFETENRHGSLVIVYKIANLIHKRPLIDLAPFLIWLPNIEQSTTIPLRIRIHASELPQFVESYIQLDLIVR